MKRFAGALDTDSGLALQNVAPVMEMHMTSYGMHEAAIRALPDGSRIACLCYPFLSPNGCGLSPDGKTLYAAETDTARLWAFDIVAPGKDGLYLFVNQGL